MHLINWCAVHPPAASGARDVRTLARAAVGAARGHCHRGQLLEQAHTNSIFMRTSMDLLHSTSSRYQAWAPTATVTVYAYHGIPTSLE